MDQRNWITESVLLFALPVAATIVAFAYESGYAYHFGIPLELITLNWTVAMLAFLALVTVFQLFASFGCVLAARLPRWAPIFTTKTALVLSPFVALAGVLLLQHGLHSKVFWIGVAVIAVLLSLDMLLRAVAALPIKGFRERFREASSRGENADPLRSTSNKFALGAMLVVIALAVAWSTGYSSARDQRRFLVTDIPNEQVILRRYGDMFVLAPLDRGKKAVARTLMFQSVAGDPTRGFTPSEVGPLIVSGDP